MHPRALLAVNHRAQIPGRGHVSRKNPGCLPGPRCVGATQEGCLWTGCWIRFYEDWVFTPKAQQQASPSARLWAWTSQPMNGQAKGAMRDGGAGLAQTMDHGLRPGSPVKASSDCSSLKPQRGLDNCLRIETSAQSPLHARHALE